MANPQLTERMRDCLERQLALTERLAPALERLRDGLDAGDWEAAADEQVRLGRELDAIDREYAALRREWERDGDVDDTDREALAALSERTAAAARRLREATLEAAAHIEGPMQALRSALGDLARGQDLLRGYKPRNNDPTSTRIDRKA
jgi:hypothetical protein